MRVGVALTIGSMSSVGAGIIDPDAQIFINRVIADGGTVEDANFLNSFVLDAKANNYWNDIVAAYSPSWGVKGTTTASTLYSLTGEPSDVLQAVGAAQPDIVIGETNGKTVLRGNGTSHFMTRAFAFNRPETIIYGGIENITWANFERLSDGGILNRALITNSTATPEISINAGVAGAVTTDLIIGAKSHLRALMASSGTELQVDNNTKATGAVATVDAGGITFFSAQDGSLLANTEFGMSILLNSAVDGSYDAKVLAIYNFSKSAYGTA